MGKYDGLRDRLALRPDKEVTLTFSEIDQLVGNLPLSARNYDAFWSNHRGRHVHADAWLDNDRLVLGFDRASGWVTFTASGRAIS